MIALCVVTFQVFPSFSPTCDIPDGTNYRATPRARNPADSATAAGAGAAKSDAAVYLGSRLGSPDAVHKPARPVSRTLWHRSTYNLESLPQPNHSHDDESQYAVDIAAGLTARPSIAAREAR